MSLDTAFTFARTTPPHPVTITHEPGQDREYTWACPPECTTRPCLMLDRLRCADWITLADHLPTGQYLAVPTLSGVDLTTLDGRPTPAAGVCPCTDPDDRYLLEVVGEQAKILHAACGQRPALPVETLHLCWVPLRLDWQEWRDEEGEPQQFGALTVDGLPAEAAEAARLKWLEHHDRQAAQAEAAWQASQAAAAAAHPPLGELRF